MAGRSRFPAGGAGGPPGSPAEEANPFSFKEFVRSKKQSDAPMARPGVQGGSSAPLGLGAGSSSASPKESVGFSLLLEEDSGSSPFPGPSLLNLGLREAFFPDLAVTNSLLDEEEEEEDWSSSYQPSAVEDAHLSRTATVSLSSTFESYYGDVPDSPKLPAFSQWQLGGRSGLPGDPGQEGDGSSVADGAVSGDGFYPPRQPSYEELEHENSKLRSTISRVQAVSEMQAKRINELERTLEEGKRKEEKEARDLEAMAQQVEENLQLMTKRAVKAESSIVRLKQENAMLQAQAENYRLENEALKRGHSANLAAVKQNANMAFRNLLAVVAKSRVSIKQLISGAEELQLAADLLKSIDKISELPQD